MKRYLHKRISGLLLLCLFIAETLCIKSSLLKTENNEPIKIMCVGDSITDGYGIPGSYRKFLYHGLTQKGYNIDMVGSKSSLEGKYTDETTGETWEYDDDNTGYSTYTIKSYRGRNGIYDTLKETNCLSQKPDIVILQIGTNNIIDKHNQEGNSEDFETLIDYILQNIPETSVLFVTTIPPLDPNREEVYSWFSNYRHSPFYSKTYSDEEVQMNVEAFLKYYNSDITSRVNLRREKGQNIRAADVNSVITDVKSQLMDGVHPNNKGYKLMGEYWTEVIGEYIKENYSPSDKTPSYKPTSINTVKLPDGITYEGHAIYSKTGKIIFAYKKENDGNTYIGVMDDDGTNLKQLWGGEWKAYYQSNGIRLMPFDDNKKILTGDYVLECSPNIDQCDSSKLLPVIYPSEAVNLPGVYFVWSEIIVSPDEHIAWSTLSSVYDDVNFLGKLVRNKENYTISNVQIISTMGFVERDENDKEILKDVPIRGGEVKQFTNGGEAIILAGAGDSALAKSVFQNLVGEENYPLTHFPGYEETTIVSPDGKLGLTMTTRFSPKTSSQILGYMPRPLASYTVGKMNMFAYMYGVIKVRESREGNIGPAVINIAESMSNPSYMGYDLHEDGWIFNSPLSWHPSCKKAMFPENNRKTKEKRIRIVHFDNYIPSSILENKKTPDNISYAKPLDELKKELPKEINGYFKGKVGRMVFNKTEMFYRSEYQNYSEDGKTFYNGYELFEYVGSQMVGKLTSDITMTGEKEGRMDLTITMTYGGDIIFEQDGKTISYGYVEYNGKKLTIDNSYNKE